jgi:hypothetical protein
VTSNDLARVLGDAQKALRGLSDDDVKAFLAGEGTIRFVPHDHAVVPVQPREPARQATPPRTVSAAEVRARLAASPSLADGTEYLTGLSLGVAGLHQLAADLGLRLPKSRSGKQIVADLVKVFVSGHLITKAVQSY